MTAEIRVPALGESVTEATIGQWFKKPGEAVAADEPVVELETDKVTIEVPAPASGILENIVAETGSSESEPMLAELVEPPAVPAGKPQPPVPVVEPIATPREAKPPSRPLADILQGFMEEKNIRLGELVAGMLIVGSGT